LPCGQAAIIGGEGLTACHRARRRERRHRAGHPGGDRGRPYPPLEAVEADMIRLALHRYRGQMSEVARKLGIGRSTLYRKMRDLGLEAKM
jgi:DNA-binding NtrC family response regulator